MLYEISFTVNDEKKTVNVLPNETLLDMLRYRLGITSPKCGCERGDCGSCTVNLNGKTVKSCLILALEVDAMEITTLEGLMKDGPTPLQKTFHEKNAFQCGYCAPGMIMSASELIKNNPHPSTEEIKEGLSGNLCRCTGYSPIINAIHECCAKKGEKNE